MVAQHPEQLGDGGGEDEMMMMEQDGEERIPSDLMKAKLIGTFLTSSAKLFSPQTQYSCHYHVSMLVKTIAQLYRNFNSYKTYFFLFNYKTYLHESRVGY